jgi:hypothetical protein
MSVHYSKRQVSGHRHVSNGHHTDRVIEPAKASMADFFDANLGIVLEAKRRVSETETRHRQVYELVRSTFEDVAKHNRRSNKSLNVAYKSAHRLAEVGGPVYESMMTSLRFAGTGKEAYADACAFVGLNVND